LAPAILAVGGTAANYLDDGEPHLSAGQRVKPLTTLVIHETGGNTEAGAERTMKSTHLGVHLLLDSDGSISNYADLADEICWHAGQANKISIGLEIVNEYRPEAMKDPHGPIIPAEWWTWVPKGARHEYVCPTDIQMRVALAFIPWICDHLGIPVVFPTRDLCKKKPRITGWQKFPKGWSAKPGPGVVEHSSFSGHADGRFILNALMAQESAALSGREGG
jgi:hypothetical protein